MIVGVIRRKPVLTHASIVCEGMLASVNSVNSVNMSSSLPAHAYTPFLLRTFSVPIPFSHVPCTGHRFWSLYVACPLVLHFSSQDLLVVFLSFARSTDFMAMSVTCHIGCLYNTVSSMSLNFPVHFFSPFLIHLFYSFLISHFCHHQSLFRSFTRDLELSLSLPQILTTIHGLSDDFGFCSPRRVFYS